MKGMPFREILEPRLKRRPGVVVVDMEALRNGVGSFYYAVTTPLARDRTTIQALFHACTAPPPAPAGQPPTQPKQPPTPLQ